METKTFERFKALIYEKSGITLGPQKKALVASRVGKRLRALGIENHDEYFELVRKDESGRELVLLLDAISTNVTSFFREPAHFDFLSTALAECLAAGQTRFRIWCAASSTGEEPYCLAMTALEAFGGAKVDLKILATDISTRVLEAARRGMYPESRMEPVPGQLRHKYFAKSLGNGDAIYTARDEIKRLITFARLNLSVTPFVMKGPMDAVFCRNVMIYFDSAVRTRLLEEVCRLLRPGGYLMIGHSESLTGLNIPLKPVQASIYRKP